MKKITGATLWLGTLEEEKQSPQVAGIGLTINQAQLSVLMECLKTGADISIKLTPEPVTP